MIVFTRYFIFCWQTFSWRNWKKSLIKMLKYKFLSITEYFDSLLLFVCSTPYELKKSWNVMQHLLGKWSRNAKLLLIMLLKYMIEIVATDHVICGHSWGNNWWSLICCTELSALFCALLCQHCRVYLKMAISAKLNVLSYNRIVCWQLALLNISK